MSAFDVPCIERDCSQRADTHRSHIEPPLCVLHLNRWRKLREQAPQEPFHTTEQEIARLWVCNECGKHSVAINWDHDCTKPTTSQSQKGDLSLLPGGPLNALAIAMAAGNEKYERDDWQRENFDKREYAGKALRHIFEWLGGKCVDEESGQSPLAHAADDLLYIIWHELNGTGVNGPEAAE